MGSVRGILWSVVYAISVTSCLGAPLGQNSPSHPSTGATASNDKPSSGTPKKTAPKGGGTLNITLPVAHAGQSYAEFVPLPPQKFYGPPAFQLSPAPTWLRYESSTSTFRGVPNETSSVVYKDITLKVSAQPKISTASQTYTFTLTVVVGVETVAVPNGPKPEIPPTQTAPVRGNDSVVAQDTTISPTTIPVPAAQMTATVNTASTAIEGSVDPTTLPVPAVAPAGVAAGSSPANYPLLAVEVEDPVSGTTSLLSFQPPGAKAGATPTSTLPIDATHYTFSFPLSPPLTKHERFRLVAVPPSGYTFGPATNADDARLAAIGERVALGFQSVSQAEIPTPIVSLPGTLSAGQSVIMGSVAPKSMPASPTATSAPDAKTGNPGSPGNLPLLAVEIADPLTKLVNRVPLLVPGTPGATDNQVQVGTNGVFTLTLKSPLSSGQTVRIVAIPPQGFTFARPQGPDKCNFGTPPGLQSVPSLIGDDECCTSKPDESAARRVYNPHPICASGQLETRSQRNGS